MISQRAREQLMKEAADYRARASKLRARAEADEWLAEALEDEIMWNDMQLMRLEDDGAAPLRSER